MKRVGHLLASLAAVLVPLLPKGACPLCLGAYGAVLSTLGLGFLATDRGLASLIVAALLLAVGSNAFASRGHGRRGPVVAALCGAVLVVGARLLWHAPVLLYLGLASMFAASLWNLLLGRPEARAAHPAPPRADERRDPMNQKRKIEVFDAGCPCCEEVVRLVKSIACGSCEVTVLDMRSDRDAQTKAKEYGVNRVPSVVVNGTLAECCRTGAVNEVTLRSLGVGSPA